MGYFMGLRLWIYHVNHLGLGWQPPSLKVKMQPMKDFGRLETHHSELMGIQEGLHLTRNGIDTNKIDKSVLREEDV